MMLKRLIGPAAGLIAAALILLVPALSGAATSGYRIQPGDTLQLEVLQDSTLNRQLLVLPDGSVTVPIVGTIQAAGQSIDAVRGTIAQGLASTFQTKPTVYLSVAAIPPAAASTTGGRTISVFVMGEVTKPGEAKVKPGATLMQALALSGGFTNYAATRRIELLRQDRSGQQQVYHFDYKALFSGKPPAVLVLQPGDVIVVPQRRLFE